MRCSDVHRDSGEPLYGSATNGDAYVFLPVPIGQWGEQALSLKWASKDLLAIIDDLSKHNIQVRLYDPVSYGCNRMFYFGDNNTKQVVERFLSRFSYSIIEKFASLTLFICVHSRRDACCALYGQRAYAKASEIWPSGSDVEILRCSHLGGDRFAGTGVCFPSGNMYGAFGEKEIKEIIESELECLVAGKHYRGCVFEEKRQQIARYAILKFVGIRNMSVEIKIISEEKSNFTGRKRLFVRVQGRTYAIVLLEREFPFVSNCRALKDDGVRSRPTIIVQSVVKC